MADPILPKASEVLAPAIDTLVALRPKTLRLLNSGTSRYNDVIAQWRAELNVILLRLSDEAASARLRTSKGGPLAALCASEFETVLPPEPQTAYATARLYRGHVAWPGGVIRADEVFVKRADPTARPLPIAQATYVPIQPYAVAYGQQYVDIQLVAQSPGPAGNITLFDGQAQPLIAPAEDLFDNTFAVYDAAAAGGSSGLTDPVLVAAAKAYAIGQFGPTYGALVAGALRDQSVRHQALFRASSDVPYAQMYIADESWACSPAWAARVKRALNDAWMGFGARVRMGLVSNVQVKVAATLELTSSEYLAQVDDIESSVRAAVRAYFDDRPDWYRWRLASLKQVLSYADPRVLDCTSVAVTDFAGNTIAEPANTFGLEWADTIYHYYLADDALSVTYAPPT